MAYNLASVRDRVIIGKLEDEDFDQDVTDEFINDAQREIFAEFELPFMEKIFNGTIAAGLYMFEMPEDVSVIQSQTITSPDGTQKDLTSSYINFRSFNAKYPTPLNNASSTINAWTSYGGNMITSAPTDREFVMTLFYIKTPDTLVEDSDVPEIPEMFSEMLVLGAFKRIQDRNMDYDQSIETEKQYNKLRDLMVARYGFRLSNGPIKMKNRQI